MGKKSAPRKFLKILYWLETSKNYLSRGESGWKCPCAQVNFPFTSQKCPFIPRIAPLFYLSFSRSAFSFLELLFYFPEVP